MSKMYLLQPGFMDDTVIYELVPKEVSRKQSVTLKDTISDLRSLGCKHVVIDAGYPREVESLTLNRFAVIKGLVPRLETSETSYTDEAILQKIVDQRVSKALALYIGEPTPDEYTPAEVRAYIKGKRDMAAALHANEEVNRGELQI